MMITGKARMTRRRVVALARCLEPWLEHGGPLHLVHFCLNCFMASEFWLSFNFRDLSSEFRVWGLWFGALWLWVLGFRVRAVLRGVTVKFWRAVFRQ